MLELVELRFKMIGRFVEEQVIVIDTLGNFVQVDGQNNNTRGSSGSGKSTVFNALDYLFGLNKIAATVLQSRKIINPDEEPIWVKGEFLLDGEKMTMMRTVGKFEIELSNNIKKGNSAEAELLKIMGMPPDLFRKIIHKRQKEGGFFLNLTPGDMHDFLMDCCNLTPFKKKYAIIEAKLKELETKIIKIEGDLKIAQNSLSVTRDAILALGLAPIKDMHEEVVEELKAKYERSRVRFTDVVARCEEMDRQYAQNRPSTSNGSHDGTIRENLEKRGSEIEAEIRRHLEEEKTRQEQVRNQISLCDMRRVRIVQRLEQGTAAKALAAKLAAEIKSIRAQRCPTCTQDWSTESAVAAEQAKLAELSKLKEIIVDAANAESVKIALELEASALKSSLAPLISPQLPILNEELRSITAKILDEKRKAQELYDQQSAEMKAKLDAFVAGAGELTMKNKREIDQARGQMDLDEKVWLVAANKLASYDTAKARFEQSYSELAKSAENFEKQTLKCKSDLEITLNCQKYALETEKAIKYYVSYSFDEALDAISDKATKIIRCIPNTSNATIQFEGTKETQKGTIKEEVNAVISVDGEIGVPIKSLSGGERTSTDLAVDLAVIDYIETKTGKGLNLFIIDEPFDGLGTVEIEMALEVFKNANINKKLIIVDHNAEVKEMVQDRIVVTRDGLTSKVA